MVRCEAEIRRLGEECAAAIEGHGGTTGTIVATVADGFDLGRRDAANEAGALLRDRVRELEAEAREYAAEDDSAYQSQASDLRWLAGELEKLSLAVYALGDPPKPESPAPEVDDDIAF